MIARRRRRRSRCLCCGASATRLQRRRREAAIQQLLATFAPAAAAVQQDPRQLLVWYPARAGSRRLFPDAFKLLDEAAGGAFPFTKEQLKAAHARCSSDWLAWERAHDAEYPLKLAQVQDEIDRAPGPRLAAAPHPPRCGRAAEARALSAALRRVHQDRQGARRVRRIARGLPEYAPHPAH